MNFHFNPHARQELKNATVYYNSLSISLGDSFSLEVERAISLILRLPEAWPLITPSARRCLTKRFPYGIVYAIRNEEIEIVAVMHLHREPKYWTDRK
ncbi:MAG TPA: type II toxin-antitoxin system RelE/ParE family toxin [Pyrinomonadaceae bacterium]|jgi:Plasmid stabilisation system protein.|nr:type II toxin-antitoxin system RelE/ParE family toxin [Pyrinomonadaceae bacterium]